MLICFLLLFAMAKIPRIGHEYQAPYWGVLVVVGTSSSDTRQTTSYHMHNIPWTPGQGRACRSPQGQRALPVSQGSQDIQPATGQPPQRGG